MRACRFGGGLPSASIAAWMCMGRRGRFKIAAIIDRALFEASAVHATGAGTGINIIILLRAHRASSRTRPGFNYICVIRGWPSSGVAGSSPSAAVDGTSDALLVETIALPSFNCRRR